MARVVAHRPASWALELISELVRGLAKQAANGDYLLQVAHDSLG